MTLDDIKARSDEFGDCWLWAGATSSTGHPIAKPSGCKCTLVRRLAFSLAGNTLTPRAPIGTVCGHKLCVNPEHLRETTTAAIAKHAGARGAFSSKARCAKIAQAKRKQGKLTMDIAREIRMSPDTGRVLAARFGVDRSLVTRIKNGTAWRDYSNPYFGLMGGAA